MEETWEIIIILDYTTFIKAPLLKSTLTSDIVDIFP